MQKMQIKSGMPTFFSGQHCGDIGGLDFIAIWLGAAPIPVIYLGILHFPIKSIRLIALDGFTANIHRIPIGNHCSLAGHQAPHGKGDIEIPSKPGEGCWGERWESMRSVLLFWHRYPKIKSGTPTLFSSIFFGSRWGQILFYLFFFWWP